MPIVNTGNTRSAGFSIAREYPFFALLSFLIVYFAVTAAVGKNCGLEVFWGCLLALVNSGTGIFLRVRSAGSSTEQFLRSAVGFNAVKSLAFLAAVVWFVAGGYVEVKPFILSLFAAYFLFLVYEIRAINLLFLQTGMTKDNGIIGI